VSDREDADHVTVDDVHDAERKSGSGGATDRHRLDVADGTGTARPSLDSLDGRCDRREELVAETGTSLVVPKTRRC
jgi:hypothetical protein